MEQVVKLKSNFNTVKLIAIWITLFLIAIFPLIFSLFQPDLDIIAPLTMFTCLLAFVITMYVTMSLHVIIDSKEEVIEYYRMKLWGRKSRISINISEAYIHFNLIRYRGNDLWELIITDKKDPGKKIKLMGMEFEFNEQQLKYMYKVLTQINTAHVAIKSPIMRTVVQLTTQEPLR